MGGTKQAKTYSGIAEHLSKVCFYNISAFKIGRLLNSCKSGGQDLDIESKVKKTL